MPVFLHARCRPNSGSPRQVRPVATPPTEEQGTAIRFTQYIILGSVFVGIAGCGGKEGARGTGAIGGTASTTGGTVGTTGGTQDTAGGTAGTTGGTADRTGGTAGTTGGNVGTTGGNVGTTGGRSGDGSGGTGGAPPATWTVSDGYVTACGLQGYAWTAADELGSTIAPEDFAAVTNGSLCVSGSVAPDADWGGYAILGLNLHQAANEAGSVDVAPTGTGMLVSVSNPGGTELRLQLQDALADEDHRWCAIIPARGGMLPWSDFNTHCWDGTGLVYAMEPINAALVIVPGDQSEARDFDFCLEGLAEAGLECSGSTGGTGGSTGGTGGNVDGSGGSACTPTCGQRECGPDPVCGSSCGNCAANENCGADGRCACVPNCLGRTCGPDGCNGSCGQCPSGGTCSAAGTCECIPDAGVGCCGDDLCSVNSCGEAGAVTLDCAAQGAAGQVTWCGAAAGYGDMCCWASTYCIDGDVYTRGQTCTSGDGMAVAISADVLVQDCGTSQCVTSATGASCQSCQPQCENRACGSDSCGGLCGTCPSNSSCSADGSQCTCNNGYVPDPTFTSCIRLGGACNGVSQNGYCSDSRTWVWCDPVHGLVNVDCNALGVGDCVNVDASTGACECGSVGDQGLCTGLTGGPANELHMYCNVYAGVLIINNCSAAVTNGSCGTYITDVDGGTRCMCGPCTTYDSYYDQCNDWCDYRCDVSGTFHTCS